MMTHQGLDEFRVRSLIQPQGTGEYFIRQILWTRHGAGF